MLSCEETVFHHVVDTGQSSHLYCSLRLVKSKAHRVNNYQHNKHTYAFKRHAIDTSINNYMQWISLLIKLKATGLRTIFLNDKTKFYFPEDINISKYHIVPKKCSISQLSKRSGVYHGSLHRLYCIVTSRTNLCCRNAFCTRKAILM